MGIVESCPICDQMSALGSDFPEDLYWSGYQEQTFNNEPKQDPNQSLIDRINVTEESVLSLKMKFTEIRTDLNFLRLQRSKYMTRVVMCIIAYYEPDPTSVIPLTGFIENYKNLMEKMGFKSDLEFSELRTYLFLMSFETVKNNEFTYLKGFKHRETPRSDLTFIYQEAALKMMNSEKIICDNKIVSKPIIEKNVGQQERQQRRPTQIQNGNKSNTIEPSSRGTTERVSSSHVSTQ